MRHLLPLVLAGTTALGVALDTVPAAADRSNDQEIAASSALTVDDVPGFRSTTPADSPTPDAPECRGVAKARRSLDAAPHDQVEFRTPTQDQVVSNKVAVLSSTKRAKQVLRSYASARAADCLETAAADAITRQDPDARVSIEVSPDSLPSGDDAVAYRVLTTATKGSAREQLSTTVAVARVGRAVVLTGLGDATGPVPDDVADGLSKLVIQRLQEAL